MSMRSVNESIFTILAFAIGLLTGGTTAIADVSAGIRAYAKSDYATARRHLERSAKAGDPQGLYNLGVLHAEGKAVPRDMATAVRFFRQGARKGSVLAAFSLAQALRKGDGVAVDFKEAARWYRFAATRGDFRAGNELGILYVEGKGVRRDPVEGFAWIYPGAHADIMDENALANLVQIARRLTRAQLEEAQARGRRYHERYIKPHPAVVQALLQQRDH